jgi:hypothetical protein
MPVQNALIFFPQSFDTPPTHLQCFENFIKSDASDDLISIRADNYMILDHESVTSFSASSHAVDGRVVHPYEGE